MGLIEQTNFDHNIKEIKNSYEEYLLSCGEFDERMFLNDDESVKVVLSNAVTPLDADVSIRSPADVVMRHARRNLGHVGNVSYLIFLVKLIRICYN